VFQHKVYYQGFLETYVRYWKFTFIYPIPGIKFNVRNTEGAAVDFAMLHAVHGPVGKLRSLTYRMIPFLAAEVKSGSGMWQCDYAISSALCQLKAANFVKET